MSDVNAMPDDLGQRLIDHAAALLAMSVYTRFGSKQLLLAAMFREGSAGSAPS